jgi:hypothetical protein
MDKIRRLGHETSLLWPTIIRAEVSYLYNQYRLLKPGGYPTLTTRPLPQAVLIFVIDESERA